MKKLIVLMVAVCLINKAFANDQADPIALLKQELYFLGSDKDYIDITDRILQVESMPAQIKQRFVEQNRRFYLFTYQSEELKIKSMISLVRSPQTQPLLCVLRGASRMESLPSFLYPEMATLFALDSEATVLLGMHRDGVSEGVEEYGGSDVADVYALSLYLPLLASRLEISLDPEQMFLIGPSRGGMQLFLALAKFPELQCFFKKFVCVSALLNTEISALKNPGWAEKMAEQFQYDGSKEWLNRRNPILALPKIVNKHLPFLIIQGTADPRICLEEGYSMLQSMKEQGFANVSYWEVFGGNHTLKNHLEYISLIRYWLISPARTIVQGI